MSRGSSHRTGRTGPAVRPHVVALVVPEPADAVPLVTLEEPGVELVVVSLRPGDREGSAALERALAQAQDRGCLVRGRPRVLDAGEKRDEGARVRALYEELGDIGPERLRTLDPDPEHTAFDEAGGTPLYSEPAGRAEAAAAALAAARALQTETREPIHVECLRAGADIRFGAASCMRYPAPVNWLTAGFDGRLTAFQPTAAGVVRRYQDLPDDSSWRGPELLEGAGLVPGLTVVGDPYGFPHLFGLRRTPRCDGGVDVAVVHASQYRTGRPLTPWNSVGGPNQGDWRKGREVGFPAAAFDGAGNLFVFVRNFGHSISCRRRSPDGSWTPWRHLGGTRVADDLVAVTTPHGGVEVYARARDAEAVVRWYLDPKGAWTEDRTLSFAVRPGTMSAAPEPGGITFRELRSNMASTWCPGAHAPYPLGEADGTGPLAMARGFRTDGWACSLVSRSGPGGAGAVGTYPDGRPGTGVWWQDVRVRSCGHASVAVSRDGRATLAVGAPGRRLLIARQRGAADTLAFEDWLAVGE